MPCRNSSIQISDWQIPASRYRTPFGTTLSILVFHCSAATRAFPTPLKVSKLPALHIQAWGRDAGREKGQGEASNEGEKATTACLCCLLPTAGWRAGTGNPGDAEVGCCSQTIPVLGLDLSPQSSGLDPCRCALGLDLTSHTSPAPGCHVFLISLSFPGKSLHCDFPRAVVVRKKSQKQCYLHF